MGNQLSYPLLAMPAVRSLLLLSKQAGSHQAVPIEFPEWGQGPVFDWYNKLDSGDARKIKMLQIRIDTSGVVPHRFIVVHMRNDTIHRLDRRPNVAADQLGNLDLVMNTAVTTKDELTSSLDPKSFHELEKVAKCEIELTLDGKVDFLVILSACYGISRDKSAQKYTLFSHNCFFFSWTILMVVSRHYLPLRVPSSELLLKRVEEALPGLTAYIVEQIVAVLIDIVVDTVTIFRNKAGDTAREGMNIFDRAAWALPIEILQFSWRKLFSARLHFGLRRELKEHVLAQLKDIVVPFCKAALDNNQRPERLDAQLWLDNLHTLIEPILKKKMMLILWDTILDAISAGYGNIEDSDLANDLMNPSFKFALMGQNATQFYAVWGAALHGALPAARDAAYGKSAGGTLSNEEVFDLAWNAGRDAALISAQRVVENTCHLMKHQEAREKMYLEIWGVWDACWEEAHPKAQQNAIAGIDNIIRKLVDTGVQIVVDELGDSETHVVHTRVLNLVSDVLYRIPCFGAH